MKKVLLVAFVAGMAMASCKKDYTCECTTTSSDPDFPSTKTSSTVNAKKKDAESSCNTGDRTYTMPDGAGGTFTYKVECAIK